MPLPTPWARLLERRAKDPAVRFTRGLRLPVRTGRCCELHSHRELELVFHPSGRGRTTGPRGTALPFEENDVILYPPEFVHDQFAELPGEDLCVSVALREAAGDLPKTPLRVRRLNDPVAQGAFQTLARAHLDPTPIEQAILDLLSAALLLSVLRWSTVSPERNLRGNANQQVAAAERYMREHFQQIRSLAEVADHVGISHDRLRHLFKTARGKTMVAYLTEVRVLRAQGLLVHTRIPPKDIAGLCGYDDPYYFSALFRRATRYSMAQYRARFDSPPGRQKHAELVASEKSGR